VERTSKELNTPKGMLLTVHNHTTPISFSLHGPLISIQFHFLCGKLIPVKSEGVTKVEAYIILEEFKQLNQSQGA
jgi:hypothetical protein